MQTNSGRSKFKGSLKLWREKKHLKCENEERDRK